MKKLLSLFIVAMPLVANAAEYKIDPAHSEVVFKVKHLGLSNVSGAFGELEGGFSFDPEKPGASSVKAKIGASSINTRNKKRDDHLQSSDFLAAGEFPEITFTSKEIRGVSKGNTSKEGFEIVGDLTIRGVTKEIVLDTELSGMAKDPQGRERAAFIATAKLNRKDFGVNYNKVLEAGGLLIGEDIKVQLEIQGVKQQGVKQ